MKKISIFMCIIATIPFLLSSCSFLYREVEKVELDQNEISMVVGDTTLLKASVKPDGAKNKGFNWSTSDSEIATVSNGTVKAKKAGTSIITVKSENGKEDSCKVTITDKEIESITLNHSDVSVKVGKKIQLSAKIQPTDAPIGNLKWTSSDEEIALVNSEGYITGVKAGIVKITCSTENNKEASCVVTVKDNETSKKSTNNTTTTTPSDNINESENSTINNSSDFIFADSSTRKLTESEVEKLSDYEVNRAINEIYARHGYVFKEEKWRNLFGSMSWYQPNAGYDGSLNSVESYNIALLAKYR